MPSHIAMFASFGTIIRGRGRMFGSPLNCLGHVAQRRRCLARNRKKVFQERYLHLIEARCVSQLEFRGERHDLANELARGHRIVAFSITGPCAAVPRRWETPQLRCFSRKARSGVINEALSMYSVKAEGTDYGGGC